MSYKQALDKAHKELEDLISEHDRAEEAYENRYDQLIETIIALTTLVGEEIPEIIQHRALGRRSINQSGLTYQVRTVLQSSLLPLSATGIRDELKNKGYDLSVYSNALATIYTTVRRLVENGEVEELTPGVLENPTGKVAFEWKRKTRPSYAEQRKAAEQRKTQAAKK